MRLKKLEIYGFKSFADRVEMVFPDGVTGVVGPNGSGKSNIGDAVRWVLGEQSAKTLRGAKMEDVIFGGTEKRRAQAYCEVTLIFDNTDGKLPVDYAEVMITRRVYRNGDSEYYINKSACRLRDIIDMMRDTGIGKEGYSLIGQGRIDEILSIKSEDRRNVFEEAAGITKFKARKAEAQRRMDNTNQNLERVEDILEEIGLKLPTLEKQAADARKYMKLTDELRRLEISSFYYSHDRLSESIGQTEAQIAALETESAQAQAQETALQESVREQEDKIVKSDARIAQLHEVILEKTRTAEIVEGELKLLAERIESAGKEIDRLIHENEQAAQQDDELTRQHSNAQEQQEALQKELEALRSTCAELEARVEEAARLVVEKEEVIERGKEDMIQSFNRLSDVKSVQARMSATREALVKRLDVLSGGDEDLNDALGRAVQAEAAAQEALNGAQQELEILAKLRAQAMETQAALQVENQQLGVNIQRAVGAQREAQSRLKMLEQMARDYEGYQNSVREVLRRFQGMEGLYGVVAGILRVPKEIERAVEMALGGAMQNIVCQREEDAKIMIDYLRQGRMGRATFLPLSSVRGRVLNSNERQVLSMEGCIGLASEIVQYDEKFRPIVENLLGRTVVARDLDAGIKIMRAGKHAFRLVTLEGDVMHSGGSMTGGSVNARYTSILSRKREIEEHRNAVASLDARVEQLNLRVTTIKEELAKAQQEQTAAGERVHQQDIAVTREQERLNRARDAVKEVQNRAAQVELEREQLRDSIAEIDEELRSIEAQTGRAQEASATTQEDITRLSAELGEMRSRLEEMRGALADARENAAGKQAAMEIAQRDAQRLTGTQAELAAAKAIRERSREAIRIRMENDRVHREEQQQALAELRAALEQEEQTLGSENAFREQIRAGIAKESGQLDTLRQNIQVQQDQLHKLQMLQNKWTAELRQLQDRIWERYELTYETAKPYVDADYDESGSRGRIDSLRAQVRALGSVNVGALQEYEETRLRYDELDKQRSDLRKAQKDLEDIINELQKKMEVQFVEQFELLNEHFTRTFTQLFGGGTAKLKLQDEKDVLNCGIDIVAQPPGKKLQLLSLLSGGERALTAIAILFAMLEIRPSPFCILDEIEAALDEANVANFADYLKQYAADTQFIVVTHRKGTMERCDALYGVAMEEKGVSRMVSVQLSDLENQSEEE